MHFFALNVHEKPLDDVRVRRAVNLAIDRHRAVEAFGGPRRSQPSCQVLPPTLYGYQPYCPYTRGSTETGNWLGPDLDTARRLIRDAHAVDARIRVLARPDQPRIAKVLADAMNRIGLRATVDPFLDAEGRPRDDYFDVVTDPSTHTMTTFFGWVVDFPEPSNVFGPLLHCDRNLDDGNTNTSFFCDRRIDAAMARALELQRTDPAAGAAAWAAIDRAVVDQAPWVFLTSDLGFDVVSERLGNYQHHPTYGMLIDQAWVQ